MLGLNRHTQKSTKRQSKTVPAGFEPARVAPKDKSFANLLPSNGDVDGMKVSKFESFSLTTRTRHRPFGNFSLASIGAGGSAGDFVEIVMHIPLLFDFV